MGCWGITAFESDAGLDSVDYIRSNLPKDGKLDLGEIIDALQKDQFRLPDVEFAENHTSPMALAEIVVKFLDGDMDGLDYTRIGRRSKTNSAISPLLPHPKNPLNGSVSILPTHCRTRESRQHLEPNMVKTGAAGLRKRTRLAGRSIWSH